MQCDRVATDQDKVAEIEDSRTSPLADYCGVQATMKPRSLPNGWDSG